MALDPWRREIPPERGVTPDWRKMITDLSASITAIIPVANVTDRAQLVAAIRAAGGVIDAAHPLYVHRQDAEPGARLEVTEDGATWLSDAVDTTAPTITRLAGAQSITGVTGQRKGTTAQIAASFWLTAGKTAGSTTIIALGQLPPGFRPIGEVHGVHAQGTMWYIDAAGVISVGYNAASIGAGSAVHVRTAEYMLATPARPGVA